MTEVVAGVASRAKPGTVVLDLDGVLYLDEVGVPGAGGALRQLTAAGHRLVFVTNNSTKTEEMVAVHIRERTGFEADRADIVTSAGTAADILASRSGTVFVVGEPGLVSTMENRGLEVVTDSDAADTVVVGLDRGVTYARFADAALAIRNGADFVATGTDATYPTPRGLYPGAGALVAAVTVAAGREPSLVCGKPHPPIRSLVRALVGPGPVWVVGDRPETDLAMGKAEGWRTVLVLTGVTADPAEVPPELAPDLVLDSIADLPAAIAVE